jgi:hypothetical protein
MEIQYSNVQEILDFLKTIIEEVENKDSSFTMEDFHLETCFEFMTNSIGCKKYNINLKINEWMEE